MVRNHFSLQISSMSLESILKSESMLWTILPEYDSVMLEVTTPFVLARTCGKILKASRSMAKLVGIPVDELTSSYYIYELLDEETLINYVERSSDLVMTDNVKSVITNGMFIKGGRKLGQTGQYLNKSGIPQMTLIPAVMTVRYRADHLGMPIVLVISIIPMVEV